MSNNFNDSNNSNDSDEYKHQEETQKALEDLGMPFPDLKDEHKVLQLPKDLAWLSDTDLGNHLGAWAGLYSRANFELAKVESDEYSLSARMKRVKRVAAAKITDKKAKVTVEKAKTETTQEYLDMDRRHELAVVRIKLLRALCVGYEKKYEAVSREISRRKAERGKYGREEDTGTGTPNSSKEGKKGRGESYSV
jgi:hypothetical protein